MAAVLAYTVIFNPGKMVSAQESQLQPAEFLRIGSLLLDVGDYSTPCVTDWNGDGRKDLLVGYRPADKVAVYLNSGSDADPVLTNYSNAQAAGADLWLPSTACGAPAPFVGDYNGDGKRDLLVGSGLDGYVYFYANTNTDAAPILSPGVPLMVETNVLTVGYRATPCLGDWDGDGLNDLLCGNGDGYVVFFKNVGTVASPAYSAGTRIQASGADLNLGIRSVVRVFDWDGDGIPDLVGSSQTGVYCCRNIGSKSSPALQAPVALRVPVNGMGLTPINIGSRMRLELVDWNNDGVMDLLLGDAAGNVAFFEGYRFAFSSMAVQPSGGWLLQWNSAPYLNYDVLVGQSVNAITNVVTTNLPSAGVSTSWTNPVPASRAFYRIRIAQ